MVRATRFCMILGPAAEHTQRPSLDSRPNLREPQQAREPHHKPRSNIGALCRDIPVPGIQDVRVREDMQQVSHTACCSEQDPATSPDRGAEAYRTVEPSGNTVTRPVCVGADACKMNAGTCTFNACPPASHSLDLSVRKYSGHRRKRTPRGHCRTSCLAATGGCRSCHAFEGA